MSDPNHTPRKTYRLPAAVLAALNEGVDRGLAVNQTGAIVAAVVSWAAEHGIEIGRPAKKSKKKSVSAP